MNGTKVVLTGRFALIVFVLLVAGFLVYALIPRMDAVTTRQTLTDAGYSQIEITGPSLDAKLCSKDDWFRTGFIAAAADGKKVSGYVCSGRYSPIIHLVE